jgi:glycosyltransferase involved in cell wall biosynthesis
MTFVDITYYYNHTPQPDLLLDAHWPNIGYFEFLPANWRCSLIKFADATGHIKRPHFDYYFFQGKASKLWFPTAANRFVASLKPDIVMVHGLIFPHQILMLRRRLPPNTKIIVQHHAERPGTGIMQRLQKMANKHVSAYLFSTAALAWPWVSAGIIEKEKVFEVMEGSTDMPRMNKADARTRLQLAGGPVFLWVGWLDKNKDPLTVLKAFEQYALRQPSAKLYMFFQGGELEQQVESMINQSALKGSVFLKGRMERKQLAYWYNAADYYISGSYSEGSGYALIEAMNCGCVPVVTDIPSFRKITANGKAGYLFKPGSSGSLFEILSLLPQVPRQQLIQEVLDQFERELSFKAIAQRIEKICAGLTK